MLNMISSPVSISENLLFIYMYDKQMKILGGKRCKPRAKPALVATLLVGLGLVLPALGVGAVKQEPVNKEMNLNLVERIPGKGNPFPRTVRISPDKNLIAVRGLGQEVHIWNWRKRELVKTIALPSGANDVLSTNPMQFSPDGKYFAACHGRATGTNTVVTIWSTETWSTVKMITDQLPGNGCSAISFSRGGESLIYAMGRAPKASGDNLYEYDILSGRKKWSMRAPISWIHGFGVSPDESAIAIMGNVQRKTDEKTAGPRNSGLRPAKSQITLIKRATAEVILETEAKLHVGPFTRLLWAPDGGALVLAAGGGLQRFDAKSLKEITYIPPTYDDAMIEIGFIRNGKYLVESMHGNSSYLKFRDNVGHPILEHTSDKVITFDISADGEIVALAVENAVIIYKANLN